MVQHAAYIHYPTNSLNSVHIVNKPYDD